MSDYMINTSNTKKLVIEIDGFSITVEGGDDYGDRLTAACRLANAYTTLGSLERSARRLTEHAAVLNQSVSLLDDVVTDIRVLTTVAK